jgi:hypothetical protein
MNLPIVGSYFHGHLPMKLDFRPEVTVFPVYEAESGHTFPDRKLESKEHMGL